MTIQSVIPIKAHPVAFHFSQYRAGRNLTAHVHLVIISSPSLEVIILPMTLTNNCYASKIPSHEHFSNESAVGLLALATEYISTNR